MNILMDDHHVKLGDIYENAVAQGLNSVTCSYQ